MNRKALPPLPAEYEELRSQLEHWRKTREKRSRVPNEVWDSAARLAEEYGINRIARALGLNHSTLKKRLNGCGVAGVSKKKPGPVFLELESGMSAPSAECVLELENRSGAKMRIELKGGRILDLLELTQAFCSQAV